MAAPDIKPTLPPKPVEGDGPASRQSWWHRNDLAIVCFGLFLVFLAGRASPAGTSTTRSNEDHGQETVGYLTLPHHRPLLRGHVRELGERVPPDGAPSCSSPYSSSNGAPPSPSEPRTSTRTPEAHRRRPRRPVAGAPRRCLAQALRAQPVPRLRSLLFLAVDPRPRPRRRPRSTARTQSHGEPQASVVEFVDVVSEFWFESFQNWQSEFLAVGVDRRPDRLPAPEGLARSRSPSTRPTRRDRPGSRADWPRWSMRERRSWVGSLDLVEPGLRWARSTSLAHRSIALR